MEIPKRKLGFQSEEKYTDWYTDRWPTSVLVSKNDSLKTIWRFGLFFNSYFYKLSAVADVYRPRLIDKACFNQYIRFILANDYKHANRHASLYKHI